jgi:hypothetical protein
MAKTKYYPMPDFLKPQKKATVPTKKEYNYNTNTSANAEAEERKNYVKPTVIPPVSQAYKDDYVKMKNFRVAELAKKPTYLQPTINKGVRAATKNDKVVQQGKAVTKPLNRVDNPFAPSVVNFANTASLGLLERNSNVIKQLHEKAPISSIIGSMAGYIAPYSAGAKLLKPALKSIAKPLFKRVVEGAIVGSGIEATSGSIGNRGLEQTKKNVAYGALLGAGADVGLYGAGKLISKGIQKFAKKATESVLPTTNAIIPKNSLKQPQGLKATIKRPTLETKIEVPSYLKPQETPQSTVKPFSTNTPINNKLPTNKPIQAKNDMTSVNMDSKLPNESFGTNTGKETAMYTPEGIQMSGQPAKVSKVYSNTLQNTDVLSKVEKDMLNSNDFTYDVKTEKMSLDAARARIQNNIDGEIKSLNSKELYSGEDVDTMMGILGDRQLPKAKETGDYAEVKNWLKNVRKAGTEGGRTVQSFAKYSRTAEGKLIEGQRAVDAVEEGLKKSNPKLIQDIDNQVKEVANVLDTTQKQAATQTLKELLPEDLLAKKIGSTLKTPTVKVNDQVTDMVNELFKSAKEAPLPGKFKAVPRNPIEYLKSAIANKGEYTGTWENAKAILKEKYADNPETLAVLNDYFDKGIIPTYSANTLNRSVQTTMKELEKKLVNIAKSSQGDKEKSLAEITDYLIRNTEAVGKDAELLASKIQVRFDEIVQKQSDTILKNMFKVKNKSVQKTMIEKVQELINLKAYDKESIRDLIKTKEGLPILDSSDIKNITKYMDEASKFPEGSYENRMNMAKVGGLIAEKTPSTGMEKFQAAQRISMLFNPKTTVVRNPLGNTLLNTMETIKNVPAAAIDKTVSAVRKSERTTILAPFTKGKATLQGTKQGLKEWKLDIQNGVDTSPVGGGVELPNKVKIFNENANTAVQRTINKAANKIHFVVGRALKLGDTPFYNAAYSERIAELKKIKKTDIITDAMKEDANLYGLERTLQNDSAMAAMFTGIKQANFLNKHPGAKTVYQTFANLVMPFAKTPANVLDKFLDYSPVGIIKATGQGLSTAGKGTFNQKKFVDTMARGLTGTGLSVLGYRMAEQGLITGARDKNSKIEGLETSLGKQNYAFKVGNDYQTIDWALPAAAPLMMGADVYSSIKKNNGKSSALINGIGSGVNLMFNSTLLQGPSKLMGGYNPAASLAKGLLGSTTQATPTVGKQISQLVDPYVRETYNPNPLKATLNKTINRIPFASKTLPKKVDTFGNDIKAFQGKNTIFNVMLNPGFKTTYKADDMQKEIIRLYNDSGESAHIPGAADKVITKTKTNPEVVLTAKEMTEYSKAIALNTASAYNMIMNTSKYKNYPDEEKSKMLASALEKAKSYAKRDILKSKGVYWKVD